MLILGEAEIQRGLELYILAKYEIKIDSCFEKPWLLPLKIDCNAKDEKILLHKRTGRTPALRTCMQLPSVK